MNKLTRPQQNSLWLYYERLAEALNDAGYDVKKTLKPEIEIPWNKQLIHDLLWLPVQEAMTGKKSTTELNKLEPSDIYLVLDRHLQEKLGISVPFPSENNGRS